MRIINPMFSWPSSWPLYGVLGQEFAERDQAAFFLASASSSMPRCLHYEVLDTIDFDLGARRFAEQDAVADLDVNRDELAALVAASGANGGYLALLRFLLGGVGNDYAAGGLLSRHRCAR